MYAGEILWKDINIGMRALPTEMSIEVDIGYSGNPVLEIETRLEVCEQELHISVKQFWGRPILSS
jgi:hypothetical protein